MNKNMLLIFLYAILNFSLTVLNAQDDREKLINSFSTKIDQAKAKKVDLLSPTNFKKSVDYYFEAFESYNQKKGIKVIRNILSKAEKYMDDALKITELASQKLEPSLIAKEDAEKSDADRLADKIFEKAMSLLKDAISEIEDGDTISAINYSYQSQKLFREAELEAIKNSILKNTWEIIEQAKKDGVMKYAPKTLQKSIDLSQKAEKEIINNRYETALPKKISEQAKYEASHAIYITNFFKKIEGEENEPEDIFLNAEIPFQKIASHFNIELKFDQPFDIASNEIVQNIVNLKFENSELKLINNDLNKKISLMENELNSIYEEQLTLKKNNDEIKKSKKIQEKVFNLFDRDEAVIYIEKGNLIVRLNALIFETGSSIIQNYSLLSKVQSLIEEFPNNNIIIENYTDIYKNNQKNLELSEARASSIKNFFISNKLINLNNLSSFGIKKDKTISQSNLIGISDSGSKIEIIIQNIIFW